MASSAQEFLDSVTADTLRCTNQFEVICTSGYDDIDTVLKDTRILGNSFTIPSRTQNFADVAFKGFTMHNLVPTSFEMSYEHTMNVYDNISGSIRRAFMAWMNKIMNMDIEGGSVFEGERGVNPKSIVRLNLFGADNQTVVQTYKFFNVKVKNVAETALQYEGGDAAKFDVQFTSTYWTLENTKEGALLGVK